MEKVYVIIIEDLIDGEVDEVEVYSTEEKATAALKDHFNSEKHFMETFYKEWSIEIDQHQNWYQISGIDRAGECRECEYGHIEERVVDGMTK